MMKQLLSIFEKAVIMSAPTHLPGVAATMIQAAWRRRTARALFKVLVTQLHESTCIFEYGVMTAFGGIVIVQRRVPVVHTTKKFLCTHTTV